MAKAPAIKNDFQKPKNPKNAKKRLREFLVKLSVDRTVREKFAKDPEAAMKGLSDIAKAAIRQRKGKFVSKLMDNQQVASIEKALFKGHK